MNKFYIKRNLHLTLKTFQTALNMDDSPYFNLLWSLT